MTAGEHFKTIVRRATACLLVSALGAACGNDATTTPDPAAPSTTVSELFSGVLAVGGTRFYSFTTTVTGTITATLNAIGGNGVPTTVVVNLGIGMPAGLGCAATPTPAQTSGTADANPVVTAQKPPGVYCVVVSDIGNLFAPAAFAITIDYQVAK